MSLNQQLLKRLSYSGLKITPQRIVVFETLMSLNNHPTAEQVIEMVQMNHPNIAIGTVYKTLETFVECNLIKKVHTEKDVMRYDAITENHHHIFFVDSENIEDYYDDELNKLLTDYFDKKAIPGIAIEEMKLHIKASKKGKE